MAAGANCIAAQQQAQVLIQADIYGHPSHGINRLGEFIYGAHYIQFSAYIDWTDHFCRSLMSIESAVGTPLH